MKQIVRRSLLAGAAASPFVRASSGIAQTTLPDKSVQLLVGFLTGGGTDIVARKIAPHIERRIGRHVTVANRPGGPGALPGELLKKDAGEGTLLGFLASSTLVSKLMMPDFPFDPLTDITPVTLAGTWPMALAVSPQLGVKTFAEYLEWAKGDDPKRRKLGSTASDPFIQAFSLMVGKAMGIRFEPASYRGASPMVNDLKDGRLSAAVSGLVSLLEHHRGGRLKILMTTAPKRLTVAPDIPTARELGHPDLEDLEWFAFFVSSRTPEPIVNEWNRQIRAVLADKGLQAELSQFGMMVETSTPQEAAARVAGHLKVWKDHMLSVGMAPTN